MSEFDAKLERLRDRFRLRLQEDLEALRKLADAPQNDATHKLIVSIVHKIAGSAGTFGFQELGREAKWLDGALQEQGSDRGSREILDSLLVAMRREIEGEW